MAARRLLIVLLLLLGISTLAAALVPPRSLRDTTGTGSTTTTTPSATTAAAPPASDGRSLKAKVVVGGKTVPVVAGPVCGDPKPRCEPIHVGDTLRLIVRSRSVPAEVEVKSFGLIGIAAPEAPAIFELLLDSPETFGILFTSPRKVAARIQVLSRSAATKATGGKARPGRSAKPRAREGSGPA